MIRSSLHPVTQQQGAVFGSYAGWQLPRRFDRLAREYDALHRGTALVDRSHLGRLRVSGVDALDLLDRLSTNKLADLEPGQFMKTVLTTGKGRIVDVITVAALSDHLLLLTSPGQQQRVAEWLDMYTFLEECVVQDVGQETVVISLVGPGADQVLAQASNHETSLPAPGQVHTLALRLRSGHALADAQVVTLHTDPLGLPGYDLLVPWEQAIAVWDALFAAGGEKLAPVGLQALEAVRVENGVGQHGREYGEEVNPLEAGLRRLISFDKGCYTGQEVVARLNTYDRVQRKLVGLVLETQERLSVRQRPRLLVDGREVGHLTSWVKPPRRRHWLALGYLRRAHTRSGTQVQVHTDGVSFPARVASLPFRRQARRTPALAR